MNAYLALKESINEHTGGGDLDHELADDVLAGLTARGAAVVMITTPTPVSRDTPRRRAGEACVCYAPIPDVDCWLDFNWDGQRERRVEKVKVGATKREAQVLVRALRYALKHGQARVPGNVRIMVDFMNKLEKGTW
jgi:hypothetical protein